MEIRLQLKDSNQSGAEGLAHLEFPDLPLRVLLSEEVHVGASFWNRGAVILGISGQWHGHPSGDRWQARFQIPAKRSD